MSSPGAMAVKAKKNLTREQVQALRAPAQGTAAFFPNVRRPVIQIPQAPATPYRQANSPASFFRGSSPSLFNKTAKKLRLEKRQANAAAAAPVGSGVNLALELNESAGGNASPRGGKRLTRKSRKTRSKKTRVRK